MLCRRLIPIEGAKAEVIEYNPGFTPDNKYVEIMDIVKSVTDTVDIMDAKILVSGGRGVGEEGFGMLKELAGSSRRRSKLFSCRC